MNCPRCGSPLVQRSNRRTHEAFMGCAKYPQCRFSCDTPEKASLKMEQLEVQSWGQGHWADDLSAGDFNDADI
jgi:ssDNA-binding Zn-finger/Zn-ribbon topoisomerase 1